jgi:hypothetical protein
MEDLLYKYIIFNKKASIPGVGVLTLKRKPAQQKYLEKMFVAPAFSVAFTHMNETADRKLYSFIAKERNIDEVEAVTLLNDYAFSLKSKLREDKKVVLPGLGILTENNFKEYQLQGVSSLNKYLPDVIANRLQREGAEQPVIKEIKDGFEPKGPSSQPSGNKDVVEASPVLANEIADLPVEDFKQPIEETELTEEAAVQKKDDWWIFAIILAILAIAAICYYYMENGGFQ